MIVGGLGGIWLYQMFIKLPIIIVTVNDDSSQYQCWIDDKKFTLAWIHSVERTPWFEHYRQEANQLILSSTEFKQFGAGTPDSGEMMPHIERDGSTLLHYKIERKMPIIHWIISRNVESKIIIDERVWSIAEQFDDYSEVTIAVVEKSDWPLIFKEKCL